MTSDAIHPFWPKRQAKAERTVLNNSLDSANSSLTEEIFASALENTCIVSSNKDIAANSTCFSTTQDESSFASMARSENFTQ